MPRRAKGPRLWLRPARRDKRGRLTHAPSVFILDGGRQIGTGCVGIEDAEPALETYLAEKRKRSVDSGPRDTSKILVSDVVRLYAEDVAPHHSRPEDTQHRLERVLAFFEGTTLAQINGPLCRRYARQSSTDAMARRDLEELRASINHHRKEGLHDRIVSIVLPERRPARDRWLDRNEAAHLLWTAWRRPKCKHVAKFILIALYTGRRAAVICGASFRREPGRPWVDLRTGMLWPPARGKVTNKRNPPIQLPGKLLVHMRAWARAGQRYVVEWGGHAITRLDKTVKDIAAEAGLDGKVTPHVFRHTAATWQMQAGTDMLEAGRYLGMTVRTLESTYAHHRPEHLAGARDAHHRHRRQRNANGIREPKKNKNARKTPGKRDSARGQAPTIS